MYQNLELIGRVGNDPEQRAVNDTSVTNFSVAVNEYRKGGEDQTTWFRVGVWGKGAEFPAKYVKKGDLVAIPQGSVYATVYEGKAQLNVRAFRVLQLTPKSSSGGSKPDNHVGDIPF